MNLCNWLSQRAVVFVGGWLLQSAYKWAFRETLPGCYCSNHLEAWISVFKVGQIFDLEILMNKAKCSRIKYMKAFAPKTPNSHLHNMMISFFLVIAGLEKSVCCVYLWNERETLWTVLGKYAAQAIFGGQNLKCIVSLKVQRRDFSVCTWRFDHSCKKWNSRVLTALVGLLWSMGFLKSVRSSSNAMIWKK